MNEVNDQPWTEDSVTAQEQAAINALRDRGFCVVIWTPSEIGNADAGSLEDVAIERGNIFLESTNNDGN